MNKDLPNRLTILRIILSGIIIILLLFPFSSIGISFLKFNVNNITIDIRFIIAGILFIAASITDFFDGFFARKYNLVTDLGKMLDAIADKMLVNSSLIIFAYQGFIPAIVPVIIVVRDIAVDAMKMSMANKGSVQAAIYSGKLKTASLMIGMALMFFYNLPFEIWGLKVADFLIYFGTIMAIISMIEYIGITKKTLKAEKAI